MINPVKEKSSGRRVSRQREAGEVTRRETRRKLLAAAAEVFAESGYAAATVAKIADRADVSVQSLYSSWGSKRALLRGVMEAALFGADEAPEDLDELPLTSAAPSGRAGVRRSGAPDRRPRPPVPAAHRASLDRVADLSRRRRGRPRHRGRLAAAAGDPAQRASP